MVSNIEKQRLHVKTKKNKVISAGSNENVLILAKQL